MIRITDERLPDDEEIRAKLKDRTTEELVHFRAKLKKINDPQAMAIRFHIVVELMSRLSVFNTDAERD